MEERTSDLLVKVLKKSYSSKDHKALNQLCYTMVQEIRDLEAKVEALKSINKENTIAAMEGLANIVVEKTTQSVRNDIDVEDAKELEKKVVMRSVIEVMEKRLTGHGPRAKKFARLSRTNKWTAFLKMPDEAIASLKEQLKKEPSINIHNFPSFVATAYNHLSELIHGYLFIKKKIHPSIARDMGGIVFKKREAIRAVQLLLNVCSPPPSAVSTPSSQKTTVISNDPSNQSSIRKKNKKSHNLKPRPINFANSSSHSSKPSARNKRYLKRKIVNQRTQFSTRVVPNTEKRHIVNPVKPVTQPTKVAKKRSSTNFAVSINAKKSKNVFKFPKSESD